MKTCKTCKYWSEKTVADHDKVSYNSYGVRHYCWLLSDDDDSISLSHQNDAEAVAHGIGGAAIATGPDFGCIHHTDK